MTFAIGVVVGSRVVLAENIGMVPSAYVYVAACEIVVEVIVCIFILMLSISIAGR